MWTFIGIISGALFLWTSPDIRRDSTGNMTSVFEEVIECSTLESLNYCHIYSPKNSSNDVIYYFHGELGNEKSWLYEKENFEFRKQLAESQKPRPHIISVHLGAMTILKRTNAEFQTLPYDLQRLESVLTLSPTRRFLYGKHLGAYNALMVSFFSEKARLNINGLILACPFVPELDPFLDPRSQLTYALDNNFNILRFFTVQSYQWLSFKNSRDWSESSPSSILTSKEIKNFPRTLLFVGNDVGFHFLNSSVLFTSISKEKMPDLILKQKPGHPCLADNQEILNFIGN